MADHLNAYVAEFVEKFELMFDNIEFGSELKEGELNYRYPLEYLTEFDKFCRIKSISLSHAGHMWVGRDLHVVNAPFNVGLVILISYNEFQEVLSFMAQSYFFLDNQGVFRPFSSYKEALRSSKITQTEDMVHEMS